MTYKDALIRSSLLGDLRTVPGLKAKALSERILLDIHYRKATDEWVRAREVIASEAEATEDMKTEILEKKVMEECGVSERRMSAEAFEQTAEAALLKGGINSFLSAEGKEIPAEVWLGVFAEMLVEN